MKLLIHAELVDAWSAESTICRGISIHTDRIKSTCSFLFFGDWLFTQCLTCITFSDRKLRCPLPECIYKCWQQSNLETHIRRQYVLFFFFSSFLTIIFINWCSFFPLSYNEKIHVCTDDPGNCNYESCDQAALIRHRKHLHGYIPGSPAVPRDDRPKKVVPVRVFRGVEAHSKFSFAEASTSASSSSWPVSPPPYPSPSYSPPSWYSYSVSPSPPVASGSRQPPLQQYYPASHSYYSPTSTYSSGESEVSLSTPIMSPPMISSPSILTESLMDPYPTHSPSFLFAPTTQDYWQNINPNPSYTTASSTLLDGSALCSSGSPTGSWDSSYFDLDRHPIEVIYDYTTPREDFPHLLFTDNSEPKLWPEYSWPFDKQNTYLL